MIRDLFRTDVCHIPYTAFELAAFFMACLLVCAVVDRIAADTQDGDA